MPIYSRNSVGSDITITANENYSFSDMGRILVECAQNDMLVFNAALKNDFKENAAIREGTMVSSELSSFREFSVKEAWGNLKAKLKKLWEKIKGVFRQVYAKLTVWLVRNGKAFVALHRKTLANKTGLDSVKIPKYYARKSGAFEKDLAGEIKKEFDDKFGEKGFGTIAGTTDRRTAEAQTNEMLSKALKAVGGGETTADGFAEAYKKAVFNEMTDTTWGEVKKAVGSLEALFTNISGRSDAIKKLKKQEKDADKAIRAAINTLNSKEKKAEDNIKGSGENFKSASTTCSAFERAITLCTRSQIAAIKTSVQQDRMVVGKLVAASPNKESALMEQMAWFEGADDFATQEDIPAEEVNAEDIQSDPDVVVNIEVEPEECNG